MVHDHDARHLTHDAHHTCGLECCLGLVERCRKLHILDNDQIYSLNGGGGAGKARGAVLDKNVAVDPSQYQPKIVPKDATARSMINGIIDTNILFR